MASPLQNDGGYHYSGGGNGSGTSSGFPADGQQQQYDNSGDTYHDGGTDVNNNTEGQGDGYAMDQAHEPCPHGTFGTAEGYSEENEYVHPTNSSGLHVLTRPSPHYRRALTTAPKPHGDRTQWWKGDSGASVHATRRATHVYNLRTPATKESRLVVASGKKMEVELIGDLDVVLHCDEDVVVTLRDLAYICLLYTSPSPRDLSTSRMPSSA